jgi:hypothetical protein
MNNEQRPVEKCVACNNGETDLMDGICGTCRTKYPVSLLKALGVPSLYYAVGLRTGEIIRFSDASIHGEFAHVTGVEYGDGETISPRFCDRGIDIRIADIVWCADVPEGLPEVPE